MRAGIAPWVERVALGVVSLSATSPQDLDSPQLRVRALPFFDRITKFGQV